MRQVSSLPEPGEVLEELRRELALVYEAIEAATQVAREFFEEYRGRDLDRILAPHIVRSEVKHFLESRGQEVEEMEPEVLANNGLLYHSGRFSLRILKAQDGVLPAPGPSERRQAFYDQEPTQHRLLGWAAATGEEEAIGRIVNLIVVWDTDHRYELTELHLALPKAGSATKDSVETHWMVPIELLSLSGGPEIFDDDTAEEIEDLPISLKNRRESGTDPTG